MANEEVLLKVEHLSQHFKMKKSVLKAVDDVNFEVKKGEVFGLVGESGCGKTTTGRSIIKLYDISRGNIYFKGQRICAGTEDSEERIKIAHEHSKTLIREYKMNMREQADKEKYKNLIKQEKDNLKQIISDEKVKVREAKDDHKYCNKKYSIRAGEEIHAKYTTLINNLEDKIKKIPDKDNHKKEELNQELGDTKNRYARELKALKTGSIMTKMQMIFQDPIASLDPRMTVGEIIAEGLIIQGIKDKKYIEEKVFEVLGLVGLVSEHAERYPHEFSGGQRQRIGIARAIIMEPDLIIADEPISALDVSIQAQIINLLNDLREKIGLTILFVAHDLSVVKYFSNRIAVMYFGKIVEMASSDELFKHPFHPYTKSLLSAIPVPDPHYEKKRMRVIYNPHIDHDYSVDKPIMREVAPEHFVYCNEKEFDEYQKELTQK